MRGVYPSSYYKVGSLVGEIIQRDALHCPVSPPCVEGQNDKQTYLLFPERSRPEKPRMTVR